MSDVIEGEAIEETGGELVPHAGGTLIRSDNPATFLTRTVEIAEALADVVRKQGLISVISGREHARVEAWTLLGSMLGVFPVVEWTRQTPDGQGWEARVVARTLAGETVGAAEAMCSRGERTWAKRDDYALRSMAQTRAISKAMRGPLGFVMTLAGFEATPLEEMPDGDVPTRGSSSQPAPEFDPATQLMDGAPRGQKVVQDGMKILVECEPRVEWPKVVAQAIRGHFGVEKSSEIPKERFPEFAHRYANACAAVRQEFRADEMPPIEDAGIQRAFAWAFGGIAVNVTRKAGDDLPDF